LPSAALFIIRYHSFYGKQTYLSFLRLWNVQFTISKYNILYEIPFNNRILVPSIIEYMYIILKVSLIIYFYCSSSQAWSLQVLDEWGGQRESQMATYLQVSISPNYFSFFNKILSTESRAHQRYIHFLFYFIISANMTCIARATSKLMWSKWSPIIFH
jgi:hypothetical protein